MKAINPKRRKFCRLVAAGETGAGAYRKAYKNRNNNTCKRNAHRLMQQPGVLLYLAVIQVAEPEAAPATATVRGRPKAAAKQTAAAKAQKRNHLRRALRLNEILSEPERRVLLSRIARGQICGTRYLVVKGNLIEKPVPAHGGQRLGCIIELNKMKGAYPLQKARKKSAAKY
jgi:hypothetical protein